MTTTATTDRRELAHRISDGIEVTLFWTKVSNRVTVEVFDSHSDEGLEFEVAGSAALDAFNHPYAYAATHTTPFRSRHVHPAVSDPIRPSAH
jgi:hypothetical protein